MNNTTQQEGRLRWVGVEIPPTEERYYHTKGAVLAAYWHNDVKKWSARGVTHYLEELQSPPLAVDELKTKFAEHLRLILGEELNTSDAYAVEWTAKELKS